MKLITTIDKRGLPFRTPAVEGQRTAETHGDERFPRVRQKNSSPRAHPGLFTTIEQIVPSERTPLERRQYDNYRTTVPRVELE